MLYFLIAEYGCHLYPRYRLPLLCWNEMLSMHCGIWLQLIATRSPALNLARRFWSCKTVAYLRTRESNPNADALCK